MGKIVKINHGFSLVEVMITLGILSVIALAISSMMLEQQKQQKTMQTKATFTALVASVQAASANPKTILDSSRAELPANVAEVLKEMEASLPK